VTRRHTDNQRAQLHVLPHWKRWRLCDIRPSDVDDWVADLSQRMGPDSVRHCYTLLRGPIRRAVKDRLMIDPLIDIVLPAKRTITKSFDDVLTGAEVRTLVAAMVDDEPATDAADQREVSGHDPRRLLARTQVERGPRAPGV
jgi:hypothetical protein